MIKQNQIRTASGLAREMQPHTYSIMYELEETHWWFAGRRRIIASFVEEICRQIGEARPRILDVGCGTGANLAMLKRYGEAEGVDVSQEAVDFCHRRGLTHVRRSAAESLPYADNSFDLVTALDVLEHLDDDAAALNEMRRVLRPEGYALLFVPAFMFLWGVQDDVSNHRRRYTLDGLRYALRAAGFEVERATYANISFFLPIILGRTLMRVTGVRPRSENNINVAALNPAFGRVFGAERFLLRHLNLPFGVSALCVARRRE